MKRVLSLLLAMVMLIGLLPSITFAGAASADELVYNFTVSAIADESIINTDSKGTKSVQISSVTNTSQLNAEVSTGLWTYVARPGYYNGALYSGNVQARVDLANIPANGLVLKTSFAEAATYSASIAYAKSTANGRVNIYFLPVSYAAEKTWDMTTTEGIGLAIADSANSASPVALAASVDMHANATDANPFAGNTFDVSAGDYYILMNVEKGCTDTSNSRYFNMISSITLTKQKVETEAKDLKYEFTLAGAGEDVSAITETNSVIGSKRKLITVGDGNSASEAGDDWSYLQMQAFYTNTAAPDYITQLTENGLWGYSSSSTSYNKLGTNGIGFKIEVPVDGKYVPKLNYLPKTGMGEIHAYILPESINGKSHPNIDGTTKTWDFNADPKNSLIFALQTLRADYTYGLQEDMRFVLSGTAEGLVDKPTAIKSITGDALELKAGTYYLMFSQETASRFYFYINSFELEVQPTAASDLRYDFSLSGAGEDVSAITETNAVLSGIKRKSIVSGDGNTASEPGDDWTYLDEYGYYNRAAGPDYNKQLTENGFWGYADSTTYLPLGWNGLVFKLEIPADGTYVPKLNVLPHSNNNEYYAYLIDSSINGKTYPNKAGNNYVWDFENNMAATVDYAINALQAEYPYDLPAEYTLAVKGAPQNKVNVPTTPEALTGEALELKAGTYYLLVSQNSVARFYTYVNSFELIAQTEDGLQGDTLEMTYSFTKGGRTDVTSDNTWLEKIELTSGANGAEGAAYRTYPNPAYAAYPASDEVPSNNWAYVGSTFGNGTGRMTAEQTSCDQIQLSTYLGVGSNGTDEWIAFKFKSPGKTRAQVTALTAYKYRNACSDVEVYVLPYEGDLKATLESSATYGTATTYIAGDYYYGRKNGAMSFTSLGISEDNMVAKGNFWADPAVGLSAVEISDNGVFELEEDKEYVLIFRAKAKGAATVEKITFEYEVPPLPVLDAIEADFGDVYYGRKLETPDVKWLAKGKKIDGNGGEVSFEIKDGGDGVLLLGKDKNIYAAGEGKATLKVTGTLRNVTVTQDVEVNVMRDDTYSGANASYAFYSGAYGEGNYQVTVAGAAGSTEPLKKEDFLKSIATTYGDKGRPWAMVAARNTRPTSANGYFSTNALGIDLGTHEGGWTAFKVKVPAPGKYNVDLGAYSYANGGLAKLYMLPYEETMDFDTITANIASYTTAENYVGEADTYSKDKVVKTYPSCGQFIASNELDYSEGYAEYLMIVYMTKSKVGSETAILLYSVDLMGGPSLKSTVTTFDYTTIGVGESTSITGYVGKNHAGEEVDVKNAYVEYRLKEGSEDILEVTGDGKSFKAKNAGVATVVTYTILDGAIVEEENTITVDDSVTIANAYIYANGTYNIGEELKLEVRLEQADRKVISGGEIISYEIVEPDEGVITLSDNGKKATITAAGTARIKAKVKARGNVYESDTITLNISEMGAYPANFAIDFRTGSYPGDYATSITSALTYTVSRNWIFHDIKGSSVASNMYSFTTDGKYAQFLWNIADLNNGNSYIAFKAQFSSAGKYLVESVGFCRNRAACMELYLIPVEDDDGTNLAPKLVKDNEYYFGTADHFVPQSNAGPDQLKSFGTNEVKAAGEYYVVFKPVKGMAYDSANGGYGSGDCWYPLYITFANGSSMRAVGLSADVEKLMLDESTTLNVHLYDGSDEEIDYDPESIESIVWKSGDEKIATVDQNGVVTGISEGTVTISAKVTRDGLTKEGTMEIFVEDTSGINQDIGISLDADTSIFVYGVTTVKAVAAMNSGKSVAIPSEYITWDVTEGAEYIELEQSGRVTGKEVGKAVISASVSADWKEGAETYAIAPIEINVGWDATVDPQIYTLHERENAIRNAKKYDWVKAEVKSVTAAADEILQNIDWIYDNVVFEGLPRYYHVGHKYDPQKFFCRYCGCNIGLKYGSYAWAMNPMEYEWKIQCPDCKSYFPSNDFKSFYQLGITDSGAFSIDIALQKHHELFVCEDVKEGRECSHNPGFPEAPKQNPVTYANERQWSDEWNAWYEARKTQEWFDYYGYGVEGSFLHNDGYINSIPDHRWGVDDGFGYLQSYVSDPNAIGYDPTYVEGKNGLAYYTYGGTQYPVQHTYIAYYIHDAVWYGTGGVANSAFVKNAIEDLSLAFVYTGEAKYGRAGAILLDRVADAYPQFDWYRWHTWRGDSYRGSIVDAVWSTGMGKSFATAYDAFLPIYNDPYVVEYLSKKGAKYETDEYGNWKLDENGDPIPVNLKDSPGAVRKNAEDNILLAIYNDVLTGKLAGNFGMHQSALAAAAVALNREPESSEMLSWIIRDGTMYNTGAIKKDPIAGGYVMKNLIEEVDRDGIGNENAPGYNRLWITNLLYLAEMLEDYEGESPINLFENPKFLNMFPAHIRLTLAGYHGAQIGDSGATASSGVVLELKDSIQGLKYTGNRMLAQGMYKKNGDSTAGIHGSILDDDPEWVAKMIEDIIEEDGELALESDMLTGFGFAALRAGAHSKSVSSLTATNTIRDFAIYYGANTGHGHFDTLNLHMSAFGLNVAPDLGYPEQTGSQPNRLEWVQAAISHNTVIVDEKDHESSGTVGTPYHFDDAGRVKLMDVASDKVYPQTDEYRRSVIMVEVDDEISYGVDFFHVNGGKDHLYSFHSQSDELTAVSGLDDLYEQPTYSDEEGNRYGVYAGADVKYGPDPGGVSNGKYPHGYTWLYDVRKYNSIDNNFSVEWNVKDWNKKMTQNRDVRLRLTMVSDEPMNEVTFATALPPQTSNNKYIGELDYLLVRRKGQNLDTIFTTVLEPYENGKQYIESIEKVPMQRAPGVKPGLNDAFSAVKVTLKNGRVDYIIYSNNSEIDYVVDGKLNFRGFAGVASLETIDGEAELIYSYLNDGETLELIGAGQEEKAVPAYTGTVKSFTKELAMDNYITYTPAADQDVDVASLAGKYVYIENDGVQNGAYKIESATENGDGDIVLDIGGVSLIRGFVDSSDIERGYVFNIKENQELRIPVSSIYSSAPVFNAIEDQTAKVGSTLTFSFDAESPVGKDITYIGTSLPRGMTINAEEQTIVWNPTASQQGENHVAITADDGTMQTTVHFYVNVYGATTGAGSQTPSTPSTPSTPGTSGGSAGGAGGAGGASGSGSGTTTPSTGDKEETTTPSTGNEGTSSGETSDVRFIDLGAHAWAADAINALADEGIIKGTSENTFSPAANITRADFALLLVRAFKLESENEENFADVAASDYFAPELAIARNTGIVNGIGDNRYAPRNTITRQDMMTIVYRALNSLPLEGKVAPEATDEVSYPDFDKVADYARDAVSFLVSEGLVNGKGGKIAPTDNTTRAEVAVLIKRILDYTAK
ncbi:MAG: S-layer homology domain-containing protein [Oscillospiraceae bacterium]|nr:S-layer homology domain-containing protein [Oscillospiraceae bacterium]